MEYNFEKSYILGFLQKYARLLHKSKSGGFLCELSMENKKPHRL